MKVCIHENCRVKITDDQVACRQHWTQLPVDIRKGLVRAKEHVRMEGKKVVKVPENTGLMDICKLQAHDYWKTLGAS